MHSQCDLVLLADEAFAGGKGLDIHTRTKIVRYWAYNKSIVIRIGDDVLEVSGNSWYFNGIYMGKIKSIGGFPVTMKEQGPKKRKFIIDLGSVYPNETIVLSNFNEFTRVQFPQGSEEAFGRTRGMLGDYKTGKLLARDGVTEFDDFYSFAQYWQVRHDIFGMYGIFFFPFWYPSNIYYCVLPFFFLFSVGPPS